MLNPTQLRALALRCLARREYSTHALAQRLIAAGGHEADVATLLTNLRMQGWLSDERFTEQFVCSRAPRYGRQRLRYELRQHGIDDDTINATLPDHAQEIAHAQYIWRKKFSHPPTSSQAYQQQARFLQQRGFAWDIIRQVLACTNALADDDAIDHFNEA